MLNLKSEQIFGINEYVNQHEGFFGIIKERFSDFQVNEVASSGDIVHLTSQEVKPVPDHSVSNVNIEQPEEISYHEILTMEFLSGLKTLNEIMPSAFLFKLEEESSYESLHKITEDTKELKINVTDLNKEKRTAIHRFIKSRFSDLNSSTKESSSEKFICVTKSDKNAKGQRKSNTWPKSLSHVHFVLYKENIDTMDAINVLAAKLRLRPGMFAYAGTKDRRAKTSQLISAYQISPQNISSAARGIPKIRVGNFHFSRKPQKLGQARGNHFRIALREVTVSDDVMNEAVNSLSQNGFINYFGVQRFSSTGVSTHSIGRALIRKDWAEAVDLILKRRDNDRRDMAEAKTIWAEKRDASLALKSIKGNKKSCVEGQLLSGIERQGHKNLLNAIEQIPRNSKLMYIHAYQSYIWNRVVSKRIRKYGLRVLVGDLVKIKSLKYSQPTSDSRGTNDLNADENDSADNEGKIPPIKTDDVRFLSESEANSVHVTEVLMPLPGYKIVYPKNELKDWYAEVLQEDNFVFDSFQNNVKTFSLGGAYRRVIMRPEFFKSSICFYDDPSKPLIASDIDILEKINVQDNCLASGAHKAILLEFCLPSSVYATMALRELLKMETSSQFQASLKGGKREEKTSETNKKRKCEEEEEEINNDNKKNKEA